MRDYTMRKAGTTVVTKDSDFFVTHEKQRDLKSNYLCYAGSNSVFSNPSAGQRNNDQRKTN